MSHLISTLSIVSLGPATAVFDSHSDARKEEDPCTGWFWSNSAKLFRPCLRIDRDLRPGGMESIQVFNGAQENVRAVRCYLGELIRALDRPRPVPQTKMWI